MGAHAQVELNLGTQIVNTTNVGVHVHVLRGALDIVGVQQSGSTVSLNAGKRRAHHRGTLSPGDDRAGRDGADSTVESRSHDRAGDARRQTDDVPYRESECVRAAIWDGARDLDAQSRHSRRRLRHVQMHASEPVVASLATGSGSAIALSAPEVTGVRVPRR